MKKLIYGGLFLATIGMGFVGCKKHEPKVSGEIAKDNVDVQREVFETGYKGILTDNQLLIFETSEIYDAAISNLDSTFVSNFYEDMVGLNFQSLTEVPSIKSSKNAIDDDYLRSLLNQDNIMQIGDYLYRINKTDESVYVLPAENINQYSDLVSENIKNLNIKVYSTDDDVIELVESGLTGSEKGIFCKDRKAYKVSSTSNQVTVLANPKVDMIIEAMYNKYGVYFTLKAVGEHILNINELKYYFQIDNSSWSQRCGSSVNNYSHPWRTKTSGTMGGGLYKEKFKFYQGMKQLKSYRFKIRFRCENWYQPSGNLSYTTYFTNYVTIQSL